MNKNIATTSTSNTTANVRIANVPVKNGEFLHLHIKWMGKDALAYLLRCNHNGTADVAVSKHPNLIYDWEAMYNNCDYEAGWINTDFFEIVTINKKDVLQWDAPLYLDEPVDIAEDDPRNDILNRYPHHKNLYNEVEITPEKFGVEIEVLNINNINNFKRGVNWDYMCFRRDGSMKENGGILQLYPMSELNGVFGRTLFALREGDAEFMNCGCNIRLNFGDRTMIQVALRGDESKVIEKILHEIDLWKKGVNLDRVAWGDWRNINTVL